MGKIKKVLKYDSILDKQEINLSTREQDIFFLSLFYVQHKKKITIPYSTFRKMLGNDIANKSVFSNILGRIIEKLDSTIMTIEKLNKKSNNNYLKIFQKLELNEDGNVEIELNSAFNFIFDNNYKRSTKRLSLDILMSLSSKYDKTLYRILSGYDNRKSGWHRVTEEEIHRLMCFPEKATKAKKNYAIKKSAESIMEFLSFQYEIKKNIYGDKYFHFRIN